MTTGLIISFCFAILWIIQITDEKQEASNTTNTIIWMPHRAALGQAITGGIILLLILPFIGCLKVIFVNCYQSKNYSIIQGSKNSCVGGCYVICSLFRICE